MVRSKDGWKEGHLGQQILQADNRASSARKISQDNPLISWRTVARMAPSLDSGQKLIRRLFGMKLSPRNTALGPLGRSDVPFCK